jgi:hypothetical protein
VRIIVRGALIEANASRLFDIAYRDPRALGLCQRWEPWTISDAIEAVTGYGVEWDSYMPDTLRRIADYWHPRRDYEDLMEGVRPAYYNTYRKYWYTRDLLTALLPRPQCPQCARKLPGRPPSYRWQDRCFDDRFSDPTPCNRVLFARSLTAEEKRYFIREHDERAAPTCSQRCHQRAAIELRRELVQLREMRLWVKTGTEALKSARSSLKRVQSHGARRSPSEASSRRAMSAT